jgi:hypothetical protein
LSTLKILIKIKPRKQSSCKLPLKQLILPLIITTIR